MTTARLTDLPADAPLEEIQDAILERLHAGEAVDRRAVLQHHAPHEEALSRFFELLDLIEAPPGGARPAAGHPPGRLGDFQIESEIGRGGMGVVYAARQLSLNRRVALKVLPLEVRDDKQRLARFQREAEAAGRLRHPNIVPVYAIGDAGTAPFFAMELVEGRSLADILRARRAGDDAGLPAAGEAWHHWCLEVGRSIAAALAYAHGQGILHRDVKPGNILIDRDGSPRLTDFGLALDLDTTSLTVSGEVFGSPRYMSPEQARMREHPVDARTDVYSLAVTLYELLTSKLPYEGNTSADILASLSNGRIVPPRKADPSLSPDVERILMHALQNDPERRYASAAELADDLASVLDGARPARAPKRWKRSAARREPRSGPYKLVLFIAALIVLVMLFFGLVAVAGLLFMGSSSGRVPVDGEQLAAVADGRHADPAEVLEAWLDVGFDTRSVVSRAEPGQALFNVTGLVPGDGPDDLLLVIDPSVSVDGGEWVGLPAPVSSERMVPGVNQVFSSSVAWATLLGDALDQDVVKVTPRVTLRLVRMPADRGPREPFSAPPPEALAGGGDYTWTGPTRTLAVYDRYPEDYPAAVSGPEVDAAMLEAVHPDALIHQTLRSFSPGRRTLEMLMRFDHGRHGPVAAAYELELWTVDGEAPIGRTTYTSEAVTFDPDGPNEVHATATLLFDLPQAPGPAEQRLLLDLEAGRVESLRLVFTPSRDVALAQPLFDRYWNVPLDLEVPVEPSPVERH